MIQRHQFRGNLRRSPVAKDSRSELEGDRGAGGGCEGARKPTGAKGMI